MVLLQENTELLHITGVTLHGVSIPVIILDDTTVFLVWINLKRFFGSLELNDEFVLMGKFVLQSECLQPMVPATVINGCFK